MKNGQQPISQSEYVIDIRRFLVSEPSREATGSFLDAYHPADIAEALMQSTPRIRRQTLAALNAEMAADVLSYLPEETAREQLAALPEDTLRQIAVHIETDDFVDLLTGGDDTDFMDSMLRALPRGRRQTVQRLRTYPDDQLGAAMSDSYLEIDARMTVKEAMKRVTENAHDKEYVSSIFVTENQRLSGILPLKKLIVARAKEQIYDIMDMNPLASSPEADKEHAAMRLAEYGESAMAVTDEDGMLLGILTYDDAMDIIAEEKEEDYTAFAALATGDANLPDMTMLDQVKGRLPWLLILLGLGLITAMLLSFFETPLSQTDGTRLLASRLAVYLPLLLGMAGNAGTQSLAIMIRYLTGQPFEKPALRHHFIRELKTGCLQGLLIGVMLMGMILVQFRLMDGQVGMLAWTTAAVGGTSIFIALVAATFLGALIPYLLHSTGHDPTVASGPFITTISDVLSLSIYYGVALLVLMPMYV